MQFEDLVKSRTGDGSWGRLIECYRYFIIMFEKVNITPDVKPASLAEVRKNPLSFMKMRFTLAHRSERCRCRKIRIFPRPLLPYKNNEGLRAQVEK